MGYLYEDKTAKAHPIVDKLNDRMRYEGDPSFCAGLDFAIQLLRDAESCEQSESDAQLQPEQKHGKWIKLSETWYGEHCVTTYACDQCGHDRQFIGTHTAAYCENCGTIMNGVGC